MWPWQFLFASSASSYIRYPFVSLNFERERGGGGGREGWIKEGGREGWRKEGGRDRGREGGREGGKEVGIKRRE